MTSPTSLNALESAKRRAPRQKDRILHAFRSYGSFGLTDEEIAYSTGLSPSTCRPRRIEMVAEGVIVDSGQTRRTRSGHDATLWRLATAEERAEFEAKRQEREDADLNERINQAFRTYRRLCAEKEARREAKRAEVRT